ncbi:nucleotide-binding universal stress UspA family protein [Litoreibacter ponti]|uniref:Nucleotide-binding universal stress UspA family protein n=1 Tax=Litoreibacter ponti TaxID=1510457 RepID=A0A2T6BEX3_9RHOB|nr:universal stress protein [Litoreibacter ponti]PTX54622.1 nucleotide-binding universal stress UspA family protein [Litoreibacter ponti]
MIKTVLCAVDINRPAEEAEVLRMAARLADLDGAQLDVISVLPDFGASVVGAYLQDHHVKTAQDDASAKLDALVNDTLGPERNKAVRHIVAVGSVYQEVLHAAEVSNTDLIVLGAHDPDLKDYLLGPNAARIVRHGTCSVFVVRSGHS